MQVNMHEAKSQLSRLGKLAWVGEKIVIARNGEPYLLLTPYEQPQRVSGLWKGQGWVSDDFDDTPQNVIDSFYGSNADEEILGTGMPASTEHADGVQLGDC